MAVAIKKVGSDIAAAVSAVMEAAEYQKYIPRDSTVFLKVNLGWDLFLPGSITNPAVFEGVVRKLAGYAGKMYVVESDQVLENVQKTFKKSNMSLIAERWGVKWINLSDQPQSQYYFPKNRVIQNVSLPEILASGVLVSLPVMKTHDKTIVTLSLKNQWGCIPKMRHMYHLCLSEAIIDINVAVQPKFALIDGTMAMDGNAPKTGRPRPVGLVGAGGDLVELDSVFAHLMGFRPREIAHLVEGEKRGLGKIGVAYTGDRFDPPEPFLPARSNFVSRTEMALRKSFLRGLTFRPPVFWGMLWAAKIYYIFFDVFKGRRLRESFRRHPYCGVFFAKP